MSEPARQSYYEIALTNRQVLSVFVVLLVSVLTAFLAGVWLGRKAAEPAVETGEAETITAATEPDEEPLERLEFFSRDEPAGDEPAAPADSTSDPSAAASADISEATRVAEEPAGDPPATQEPAAPEPQVARAEEARPVEPPAAEEPPPAVAEPAPAESAPAAAAQGTLVVQVFSSNNQSQAQGVVDRLRAGGFPALLSPVEVSGRTMYRVRIGPYSDRQVAEGIAEQVRREYRLETWITE